jgi:arabinogalactan endo-1,4-beta-galactosidase
MRYLILFYKEKGDEKMRKRCLSGLLVLFLGIVVLAGQNGIMTIKAASVIPKGVFAKGADVSWLSEMEYYNWAFYNDNWVKTDCLRILADHGINSIRLRLWVNPAKGFSDEQDMLKLAKRAKAMGFRLMIDFHYSDSWADPGKQTKPTAWAGLSFRELQTKVYDYTYSVMKDLIAAGVTPEWVQIGNETNDGMLWDDGKASRNMKNFAALVNCGYYAVKAVSGSTKVIIHVSNGYDNTLFRWLFDGLTNNGANFDVIGMSLYPTAADWDSLNKQCLANMKDMISRYGKEVMICEVGMNVSDAFACKAFLTDLIKKTKSVGGLGVFYWEPECYGNWYSYYKGVFDESGKPTVALDAFLN